MAPVVDQLILSRTDSEKSASTVIAQLTSAHQSNIQIVDWLNPSWQENLIRRIEMHHLVRKLLDKIDSSNRLLLLIWNLLAYQRLKRGVNLLSRGQVVITDRLHAHILSVLMHKPHILLDNSYGKLGGFYQAWTNKVQSAQYANSVSDVEQMLGSLNAQFK